MKTIGAKRHQIITRLNAQQPEETADAAVKLWQQMATEIISIVGVSGFNSLYARSTSLAKPVFPWLSTHTLPAQNGDRFTELKTRLEGQAPAQASEANCLLLITFTDILSTLIGEQLTTRILCSAWGVDASTGLLRNSKNEQ